MGYNYESVYRTKFSQIVYRIRSCGLYYKHVTIVIDDSFIVRKLSFELVDDVESSFAIVIDL
jgi:hypothetical protein